MGPDNILGGPQRRPHRWVVDQRHGREVVRGLGEQLLLRHPQRAPRVRSRCCFRRRGTESLSKSGMTWMNGGTKRRRDRARAPARRWRAARRPAAPPRRSRPPSPGAAPPARPARAWAGSRSPARGGRARLWPGYGRRASPKKYSPKITLNRIMLYRKL